MPGLDRKILALIIIIVEFSVSKFLINGGGWSVNFQYHAIFAIILNKWKAGEAYRGKVKANWIWVWENFLFVPVNTPESWEMNRNDKEEEVGRSGEKPGCHSRPAKEHVKRQKHKSKHLWVLINEGKAERKCHVSEVRKWCDLGNDTYRTIDNKQQNRKRKYTENQQQRREIREECPHKNQISFSF